MKGLRGFEYTLTSSHSEAFGGEVEMDILVTPQPTIDLRLMGAEIVEDDVNGGVGLRKAGDDLVHELKEFDTPSTLLVGHRDLAGSDLKGGEQGRGAVAGVVVTMASQRPAIGQFQVT